MGKYKFDELQKKILERMDIDRNGSSFNVAVEDGDISFYPVDFKIDCDNVLVNGIKNSIINFTKVVMDNPNFDITNFKSNLDKNIVIGVSRDDVLDSGDTVYDENRNLFQILADKSLVSSGVIYHELFHLASRPEGGHTFRLGLREGYTEALTHKYFSKSKLAYPDNVYYALKLEKIIGSNLMENAYSKGDASILIDALGGAEVFDRFNDNMDLLLGSYYRSNSGTELDDEEVRVNMARKNLEECLDIFKERVKNVNKTI